MGNNDKTRAEKFDAVCDALEKARALYYAAEGEYRKGVKKVETGRMTNHGLYRLRVAMIDRYRAMLERETEYSALVGFIPRPWENCRF